MAINVDMSKPLSEEQIEDLRARIPEQLVQHYIALAKGVEFEGGETKVASDPPASKAKVKVPPPPPPEEGDDK